MLFGHLEGKQGSHRADRLPEKGVLAAFGEKMAILISVLSDI
nr:Uncharacterised protein [Klebsiella pneumoniae]